MLMCCVADTPDLKDGTCVFVFVRPGVCADCSLLFPCPFLRVCRCVHPAAAGLEDYGESEVFADDWFGEASPLNDMHTVDRGRWAFLPVMKASQL